MNIPTKQTPRWLAALLGGAAVCAGLLLPWLMPSSQPARTPLTPSNDAPFDPSSLDVSGSLVRLYAVTLVVLGIGIVGIYFYRRRLASWSAVPTKGQIEVLGAVRIDLRSHVVLVRVRGQKLLAGIDASGLKLLVGVSMPEVVEATAPIDASARTTVPVPIPTFPLRSGREAS